MKTISMTALAAALLVTVAVFPPVAVAAGKKEVAQPESPTNFVLSKQVRDSAAAATRHGEVTQDLRLPMGPIFQLAAVLSLLLGLRSFIHALLGVIYAAGEEAAHGE